jgi:hypothetical protein
MNLFRERPHWYALTLEYGLGLVAVWHLAEDLLHGQGKVYSGEFYPWRQTLDMTATHYAILACIEAAALLLFFARIHSRWCAAVIGIVMFIDNLGSYLNHRLLMSIEFLVVSLMPAPAPSEVKSYRETAVYWDLDLIRYQLSLVYAAAALHKLNDEFLSGRALRNLFWMTHHHGMKAYPDWLGLVLEDPGVCKFLAGSTIATELTLAVGLNFRKTVGPCLLLAIVFHLSLAVLMAYIKIFTALVLVSLVAYVPNRIFDLRRYTLVRRSAADGPRFFLKLLWPGYIEESVDQHLAGGWRLVLPNGTPCSGYAAWAELMSLSPVTLVLSEIMRVFEPSRAGFSNAHPSAPKTPA